MSTVQQYRRVCIQRSGYAVVPGNTDQEALENAARLKAGDFGWEDVTPDLIHEEGEIVEVCGPLDESIG